MPDFEIPTPMPGSDEPSDLTTQAMLDLTASKRNTALYERSLSEHIKTKEFLMNQIGDLQADKKGLENTVRENASEIAEKKSMERARIESAVSFGLATIFMTIGGALISGYPALNDSLPWQFVLGWTLLLGGVVLGVTSRVLVWVCLYITKRFKPA